MYNTIEEFNELPEETRKEVISIMGWYDEVGVERANGRTQATTCITISSHYAPDHKFWYFNKAELKKQYAREIEAEEKRFQEETKDFDWELLNN